MAFWGTWRADAVVLMSSATAAVLNSVNAAYNLTRMVREPLLASLLATLQVIAVVVMVVLARRAIRALAEHHRGARMRVRVVRGDQELRCRLICIGRDGDGMMVWAIMKPEIRHGDAITIGVLPPKTTVWFPSPGREGP